MTTLRVLHPGMRCTVQDLGRPHLRQSGLPTGGAVDALALRTANLLAGNAEDAAALECAWVGPVLTFARRTVVAVAGARVDGVPYCQRIHLKPNSRLDLSRFTAGAYAYLAVAGGIDVPIVLGSRATDLTLQFGGFNGRPLKAGDTLACGVSPRAPVTQLRVAPVHDPRWDAPVRVVDGRDARRVGPAWMDQAFTVSSRSDRMGVRLDGPAVAMAAEPDAASAVVLPGTLQLPPDGTPIALLADAQTLGGYPQIAHVIAADLPRLAQTRPGRTVRFERVTLAEAHRLLRQQARHFGLLRQGIRLKLETA